MVRRPQRSLDLLAELQELKQQVDKQALLLTAETDSIKQQLKLSKEIADLRTDYEKTIGSAKWFATIAPVAVSILLFVAGAWGYNSLKSLEDRIEQRIESAMKYNVELSQAYQWMSLKEYDSAIRILSADFESHPYDPKLLIPLLHAYDETEQWEEGEKVIERIEANKNELDKINDPMVLNNIATLRIQQGVEDPNKLENGIEWLKKSAIYIPPNDADSVTYMNINFFLAALAKQNLEEARTYGLRIAVPKSSVSLDPWSKIRSWRFFRTWLPKHSQWEATVARIWTEQAKRLEDMQK